MRHPFSFSWRLEAQDVARTLSQSICRDHPSVTQIITDQRPRAQLTAQRLVKLLKRCGIRRVHGEVMTQHKTRQLSHSEFDELIAKLEPSRRVQRDRGTQDHTHKSALVILSRGTLLTHMIHKLTIIGSHLQERVQANSWHLSIYTGLGAKRSSKDLKLSSFVRLFTLERPSLSERGQRYLERYPQSSTLALEILDLSLWLNEAVNYAQTRNLKLSEALNHVKLINGVWGQREIKQGKLTPASLSVVLMTPPEVNAHNQ